MSCRTLIAMASEQLSVTAGHAQCCLPGSRSYPCAVCPRAVCPRNLLPNKAMFSSHT